MIRRLACCARFIAFSCARVHAVTSARRGKCRIFLGQLRAPNAMYNFHYSLRAEYL